MCFETLFQRSRHQRVDVVCRYVNGNLIPIEFIERVERQAVKAIALLPNRDLVSARGLLGPEFLLGLSADEFQMLDYVMRYLSVTGRIDLTYEWSAQ